MSDEGGYTLLDHHRLIQEAVMVRDLSRADIAVLVALLGHCYDGVDECFPGLDRIAERAAVSRRSAMRCIQALENAGFLEVDRSGRSNSYKILFDSTRDKVVTGDKVGTNGEGTAGRQVTNPVAIGDKAGRPLVTTLAETGDRAGTLNSFLNPALHPNRNPLGFASLGKSQQQDQKRSPEEQELETRETWRNAYRKAKDRGDVFLMQHIEQSEGWERIADLIDIAH